MHFGSSTSELFCTNRHLTKTSDIVIKLSQCAFNTQLLIIDGAVK